jgi:hypothetical protein
MGFCIFAKGLLRSELRNRKNAEAKMTEEQAEALASELEALARNLVDRSLGIRRALRKPAPEARPLVRPAPTRLVGEAGEKRWMP